MILAALMALLGLLMLLLAIVIANSTRPGTRKRWLRAVIAAPLGALGLYLAIKPAVGQPLPNPLPAAMMVLYPMLTDDRPVPVRWFDDVATCQKAATDINKDPRAWLNEQAIRTGSVAVCFTPAPGTSV